MSTEPDSFQWSDLRRDGVLTTLLAFVIATGFSAGLELDPVWLLPLCVLVAFLVAFLLFLRLPPEE